MNSSRVMLVSESGNSLRTEKRNGGTYALGEHEQAFGVRIENLTHDRIMATIKVNGDEAGSFVVNGARSVVIKRPSNTNRAFTFIKVGTLEAERILRDVSREDMGLVEVNVYREKRTESVYPESVYTSLSYHTTRGGAGGQSMSKSAAGVGLGKETNQSFVSVDFEPNHRTKETHYIRLQINEPEYIATSEMTGYPQAL